MACTMATMILYLALTTTLHSAILSSLFGVRIAYSYAHVLNPVQKCAQGLPLEKNAYVVHTGGLC